MLRALVLLIYNLLLPVGLVAMLPGAWKKMRQRGGRTADLWQRLGFFGDERIAALAALQSGDGGDGVIWIHAVSVGEVGIAAKLTRELLAQRPRLRFVLTTTTPTGFALAKQLADELAGKLAPLYSPVDGWGTVRRFLRAIRPKQLVLVEAEVWPNLVFAASRRGIPVALVNARLSERSEKRFRALRCLTQPIFSLLDTVCVQEPQDIERFAGTFGIAPRKLIRTGSIKFDMAGDAPPAGQIARFRGLLARLGWSPDDPVLIAASTHAGEELAIARIHANLKSDFPALRLILVPRHVERTPEIETVLSAESISTTRRSTLDQDLHHSSLITHHASAILLVDTTGELRAWQHLATVVVIGKSFLATGGQNPAEAVMAGKPVVFGPHMENFEALVRLLLAGDGGAVQVNDWGALEAALANLLRDESAAGRIALAGREALRAHEGSTRLTAERLLA